MLQTGYCQCGNCYWCCVEQHYEKPKLLMFTLDGFHNREARYWVSDGKGYRVNAPKHAKQYNNAGVWHGDGSFTLYFKEGDRVRQKTWQHAAPRSLD